VGQASYRIPAVLGRQLQEVTLTDQDWAILQSRFGIAPPDDDEGERWLPRSALLDLEVSLGRNIWLRRDANPELALQFTGNMRVTKGAGDNEILLQGNVESIPGRSYVEEFGRRFTLEEGVVTFRGPVSRTSLQVAAEYRVPTSPDQDPVTIRLDVTGGLDELELALSSEPSLSNTDIVSYLATGRPASTAFSGDGSGGLGADILASRLSGSLEQLARNEVGLDVLQIQQDGLQGTSLVAGKYVNPRLFLGFRQGVTFQADDGRSFTEGLTSQAEVEYAALDWLVLNVQGGTSAIRFFLEATYGW
jgi:translocation and assembly module TamB